MINTRIPASDYKKLTRHKKLIIFYGGEVWVPVEITMLGKLFVKAWETGVWEYQKWSKRFGKPRLKDLAANTKKIIRKDFRNIKALAKFGLKSKRAKRHYLKAIKLQPKYKGILLLKIKK